MTSFKALTSSKRPKKRYILLSQKLRKKRKKERENKRRSKYYNTGVNSDYAGISSRSSDTRLPK